MTVIGSAAIIDAEAFAYMIDRGNEIAQKGTDCLYEPLLVRGLETGTGVRG